MNIQFNVREYDKEDLPQLIKVYQSAFAEPPWDEFKKCSLCGINYGIIETKRLPNTCKKCSTPLKLEEFWSSEDVRKDLDFARLQEDCVVLVAELDRKISGFTWGYKIPLEKFPFLRDYISNKTNYMDEIAVAGDFRRKGIGKILGEKYIEYCKKINSAEIILRTDQRNISSMSLFKNLGFKNIGITDPEFSWRIYLRRKLND